MLKNRKEEVNQAITKINSQSSCQYLGVPTHIFWKKYIQLPNFLTQISVENIFAFSYVFLALYLQQLLAIVYKRRFCRKGKLTLFGIELKADSDNRNTKHNKYLP